MTLTPDLLSEPSFEVDDRVPPGQPVALPTGSAMSLYHQGMAITQEMIDPSPRDVYQEIMLAAQARNMERLRREDEERMRRQRRRELNFYDGYHSPHEGRDWYCYCSPGRGQFFNAYHQDAEMMRAMAPYPSSSGPDQFVRHSEQIRANQEQRRQRILAELEADELAHICQPDANGVCVWVNCPNAVVEENATPWMPDQQELEELRQDMQAALVDDSLRVTYHRWDPPGEWPCKDVVVAKPELSKELAIREVIPAPKPEPTGSILPILAGIGCSVMAGFLGCLVFALAVMH